MHTTRISSKCKEKLVASTQRLMYSGTIMTKHAETLRSNMLNMRIEPKLHYLASIAALDEGMSLSSAVEDALYGWLAAKRRKEEREPGIDDVTIMPEVRGEPWGKELWYDDPGRRLFELAVQFPGLLKPSQKSTWIAFCTAMAREKKRVTLSNFLKFYKGDS
jgi:hypothetical protein